MGCNNLRRSAPGVPKLWGPKGLDNITNRREQIKKYDQYERTNTNHTSPKFWEGFGENILFQYYFFFWFFYYAINIEEGFVQQKHLRSVKGRVSQLFLIRSRCTMDIQLFIKIQQWYIYNHVFINIQIFVSNHFSNFLGEKVMKISTTTKLLGMLWQNILVSTNLS